tara:strand:- start:2374 stop:2724 length:351 start_codon:yes stop_codon:yes gene_type:complete
MLAIYKKDNILYTLAENGMEKDDIAMLITAVSEHLEKYESTAWYIEVGEAKNRRHRNIENEMEFKNSKQDHLKKVALVGSIEWQEEFTKNLLPFSEAHIKYFHSEDKELAKSWIEK